MSDLKRSETASEQAAVHQDANSHSQDATTTADRPSNKETVIEVPDDVPDTTKPSVKLKKRIAVLSASLLVAVIFAAFMLWRPKCLLSNFQINCAIALLISHDEVIKDLPNVNFNHVKCKQCWNDKIVELEKQAKNRSPTSFPHSAIIPWESDDPIPNLNMDWVSWFKRHPNTTLHLYYMFQLFRKYKSKNRFSIDGYTVVLGCKYLDSLCAVANLANKNVSSNPYKDARDTIFTELLTFNLLDSTPAEQNSSCEIDGFYAVMQQIPLQYARYTFVVSRLQAHDMGMHCNGEELHAALPDIFPCVPPDSKLGGSYEEHMGRTVATWGLAGHYLGNVKNVSLNHLGAWVCAGFDPATGTASLTDVQKYYIYDSDATKSTDKTVHFMDFASFPVSVKKVAK